jgi:HK97 gp10 family phage protein
MQVDTDEGAIRALANSAELLAVSMRAAKAGSAGAKRRARVRTGEMRNAVKARRIVNGARVMGGTDHDVYNEFGTSKMSAQPFIRPSMDDARAAL